MASVGEKSVLRKVFFFRLAHADTVLDGIRQAVEHIATLPFNDQGRYLPTSSDDILFALFVTRKEFPLRLQFARIKRADLPLVEDQGAITPLKIAKSAGVLDWAHIVIFDDGIVAAEFNRDAPRLARLGEYLYFKARGKLENSPKFLPLFEKAVLDELSKFESVSILEVEALTAEAESIAEADGNLAAAFGACRRAGEAQSAKLILKASVKGQPTNLRALAERLFRNSRSREALTNLKVTGKTAKGRRPLDMLQDYLVSTENFMKSDGRSRAVASDDAFRIIEGAYAENKDRFPMAATANEIW